MSPSAGSVEGLTLFRAILVAELHVVIPQIVSIVSLGPSSRFLIPHHASKVFWESSIGSFV